MLRRSAVLPFLVLAYPLAYLFYRGGIHCEPVCFQPTPRGVALLLVGLSAVVLVSTVVASGLELETRTGERRVVRWLVSPSPLAGGLLLGVFAVFVVFLTVDAVTAAGALWKPVVLPVSFLLFLPVWALYTASFPLAILFSLLGIESSPTATLFVRWLVLFVGFPLSAVFQTFLASAVVETIRGRGG